MVVAVVAAVMAADNKAPSLDWDLGIWFGLAWGWQIFISRRAQVARALIFVSG